MENEFKVDSSGIIRTLGKFEGEPRYVPYYWDISMEQGQDDEVYFNENEPLYLFFVVTDEDKVKFPELADIYGICLYETEQGFVNSCIYGTSQDYNAELERMEFEAAEEIEEEGE
jgi:hypothetical protein